MAKSKIGFALGSKFLDDRAASVNAHIDKLETVAVAQKAAAAADAKKSMAAAPSGAPQPPPRVEQPAVFDKRLLDPEFAIGQQLLTRDEYLAFRNGYVAQSELSIGLIFPLALVIFAFAVDPHIYARNNPWVLTFLIVATAALFMLAIERRQKYKIELKSLLLGRWEKQAKADKEAKQAKKDAEDKKKADEKKTTDDKKKVDDTAAALRKILKEELDKLNLSVKPIVVEVHTHPAEKKDEDEDNLAGSSA